MPLKEQEPKKLTSVDDLVKVLMEVSENQKALADRITAIEFSIDAAIKNHIRAAFAGGDVDGHRRAHESMIELIEEKRKLRVAIQEKTISGLIWVVIVWVFWAMLSKLRVMLGGAPL